MFSFRSDLFFLKRDTSMTLNSMLPFLLFGLGTASLALALAEMIHTRHSRRRIEKKAAEAVHLQVLSLLEPVLLEARSVADAFDGHVAEKRLLVTDLNRSLENRIASLKLLLNRADALLARNHHHGAQEENSEQRMTESRQKILQLLGKGYSVEEIAERLSIAKGEVSLVVGLQGAGREDQAMARSGA